jgi:hypothetical protein
MNRCHALRGAVMGIALSLCASLWVSPAMAQQWKPSGPLATPPSRQASEEAKERYKKGLKLYQEDGAVEAALIEFERAYDLAPSYKVLYNIGQVARSLPDYVTSLRAFERYLQDGGKEITSARRVEVEKEIAEMRSRVASVEIRTNVDGATVLIDDIAVGRTPLTEPILVNAGRHKVSVAKDTQIVAKLLTLAGRDQEKIDLPLEAPRDQQPAQPPPPPPPPSSGQESPPPLASNTTAPSPLPPSPPPEKASYTWIGWVATGVFALSAGVTGGLALSASGDLKSARYAGPNIPDDISATKDRVQTLAVVTDILGGAAVAALGITIVVVATTSKPTKAASQPAAPGRVAASQKAFGIRLGPRGAALEGSF